VRKTQQRHQQGDGHYQPQARAGKRLPPAGGGAGRRKNQPTQHQRKDHGQSSQRDAVERAPAGMSGLQFACRVLDAETRRCSLQRAGLVLARGSGVRHCLLQVPANFFQHLVLGLSFQVHAAADLLQHVINSHAPSPRSQPGIARAQQAVYAQAETLPLLEFRVQPGPAVLGDGVHLSAARAWLAQP
jgi:hypothetical protein